MQNGKWWFGSLFFHSSFVFLLSIVLRNLNRAIEKFKRFAPAPSPSRSVPLLIAVFSCAQHRTAMKIYDENLNKRQFVFICSIFTFASSSLSLTRPVSLCLAAFVCQESLLYIYFCSFRIFAIVYCFIAAIRGRIFIALWKIGSFSKW